MRLRLIDEVRALLEGDARIDGLVLIGSGAEGFRDELSDVDLMAAVVSGVDPLATGDELAARLAEELDVYRYIQTAPARALGLHVFLLQTRLELDLSFRSIDELRATESRWRVLFDRAGRVEARMSLPVADPPDRAAQVRFRYLAGCGSLWFGLKAVRRGEHLLAAHRLGELRGHVVALAFLDHFGSDERAAQRADALPEADRAKLSALHCEASGPALDAALRCAREMLAAYDRRLLREAFGDESYAGLAEWLAAKYDA